MSGFVANIPAPINEPILGYLKGSPERAEVEKTLKDMRANPIEIPIIIGGKEVKTGKLGDVVIPHEHKTVIARFHKAGEAEVQQAIANALEARRTWAKMPFEQRAGIFLKAAELLAGPYRQILNASTILGQSKNIFQAEIDSACESIDFLRFNVKYAEELYQQQPVSSKGVWNRVTYRALEGFVFAGSPFNFTAIGLNLCTAPAMMGNVVIWKPAQYAVLSNYYVMKLLMDAGLPAGVINFVPGDPEMITRLCLTNPDLAGIHYTGSTGIFQGMWKMVGNNIHNYKSYPRIVGETGGKDFVFVHASADPTAVATALVRGAFEYAGQKCSAASRGYIPASLWPAVKQSMLAQLGEAKYGNPEHFDTLTNAVIHKRSFDNCKRYIEEAKKGECEIVFGGACDDSVGYFVQPTVIVTTNPKHKLMCEEIFGPILTLHVYPDDQYAQTLAHCDETSPYALTGSIFGKDRVAVAQAMDALENAAGNFYVNDKPTGAVVGQQPFGGGRASGTNDKAGSSLNLIRWVSMRTIKETFVPPTHFAYPYMK